MRPNRITIISIFYPPEQGAAATRIANMAIGLRARNLQVDVVTALPNYPTGRIFAEYRGRFTHAEVIDGVPVRRFWLYPSNSAVAVKRILNMLSFSAMLFCAIPHLLRRRTRTIIVNTPPLPAGLSGVILAKLIRARVITNVSDVWPLSGLELGAIRKGWFYAILEWVERCVYRFSDAIVTQSEETRQHVLARTQGKKTFLYRNLLRTSEFSDKFPGIHERPTKIVYAGLLGVAQGVYEICKSIDFKEAGIELDLYGDGNEREKIERYIADHPDCNISMHGNVPQREIPRILTRFHATIVPLRRNIHGAFPSKIYMAISTSLPVLFCGSGEGALFVRDTGIGWVSDPGDYAGLRKNLELLARMDDRDYRALRNRIRELAASTYDLDDQLDRFVEFLGSVS